MTPVLFNRNAEDASAGPRTNYLDGDIESFDSELLDMGGQR
jgi:hypothetical protein